MFALNAVTFSAIKGTALSLAIVNAIVIAGVLICMLALLITKTGKAKKAPKDKRKSEPSCERQTGGNSGTQTKTK